MASYLTAAEAAVYFTGRTDLSSWSALTAAQQTKLLEQATRILDDSFDWQGIPVQQNQTLRWPRKKVFDRDGRELSSDSVPDRVKEAAAEQALYLSDPAHLAAVKMTEQGIRSTSVSSMSMTFSGTAPSKIAPAALELLRTLGTIRSSSGIPARCGTLSRG